MSDHKSHPAIFCDITCENQSVLQHSNCDIDWSCAEVSLLASFLISNSCGSEIFADGCLLKACAGRPAFEAESTVIPK